MRWNLQTISRSHAHFAAWLVFWLKGWSDYGGTLDPGSLLRKFRGDGGLCSGVTEGAW